MVDGICPLDGHGFVGKTPEKKAFCDQIHITAQPIMLCKRWVVQPASETQKGNS